MVEEKEKTKWVMTDGSELIIESLVRAGANAYVNYPITPSNWLNAFALKRFPFFMPAPDEITTLQWLCGMAAAGKIPVTATSFPGYALMIETMNEVYMMELPMVIILVQRLGPSTGSATVGAEGDLLVMNGTISGGFQFPVFSISSFEDCWNIPPKALKTAVELRTPVVILTSKEMIMTSRSFDLEKLHAVEPVKMKYFTGEAPYKPYKPNEDLIPEFLPVGNEQHQVRINSSTHDHAGMIKKATPEAIGNSLRLQEKIEKHIDSYSIYTFIEAPESETLIVTYGITSEACRESVCRCGKSGKGVSLLILNTLIPLPKFVIETMNSYRNVIVIEENSQANLVRYIYGVNLPTNVKKMNAFGRMITPSEIMKEIASCR